jgi:hypothetical protein
LRLVPFATSVPDDGFSEAALGAAEGFAERIFLPEF